jgi:hypothetical protein
MARSTLIIGLIVITWGIASLSAPAAAGLNSYVEDFTTDQYMDMLYTTAWWDTVAGELKLNPHALNLVGSYPDGSIYDIALAGDVLYAADYAYGIRSFDISDPANPMVLDTYSSLGGFIGITVDGDYAYCAHDEYSLIVIDISDPADMSMAGWYDTTSDVYDVAVAGNIAYVASDNLGLYVVDISDPTNPVGIGMYDTGGSCRGVAIAGDYAYLADYGNGLQVIDISNPTTPSPAGGCGTPGLARSIAVDGDYAYVADDSYGLQVIDISDPTSPFIAGSYDTPGSARQVAITGDHAYVADYDNGALEVIDISDPTSPYIAGSFAAAATSLSRSVALAGVHAFIGESGLCIVEIADPILPPEVVEVTVEPQGVEDIAVAGDYAYVAGNRPGFYVMDISDPENPYAVANLDSNETSLFRADRIAVHGDYVYMADNSPSDVPDTGVVWIFDVSDPTAPTYAGSLMRSGKIFGWDIEGNYLYAATEFEGLVVFDMSDPVNLIEAGGYYISRTRDVKVSGDYAFLLEDFDSLSVFDVSDPENPVLANRIENACYAGWQMTIDGDYLYFGAAGGGVCIYDITDPANPVHLDSYDTYWARNVLVSGDYAFVGDVDSLIVLDVTDPANPVSLGGYENPDGENHALALSGDYIFTGGWNASFRALRVFDRTSLDTLGNVGRSIVLNSWTDPIRRVRLSTVQTDSIAWEVSADSGSYWQEIEPGGSWLALTQPGGGLLWRSTHVVVDPDINPTCSSLTLDWLYEFASIDSIIDVPGDQGGWLRIYFSRSAYDFLGEALIHTYYLWQRIDDYSMIRRIEEKAASIGRMRAAIESGNDTASPIPGVSIVSIGDRSFVSSRGSLAASGFPPGVWEVVGSVPAIQQEYYVHRTPTVADSTASGVNYSVYVVTAHTADPATWYASYPDSGYSVDNIAPEPPGGFAVAYNTGSGNDLSWNQSPEEDLQYYSIYRDEEEDLAVARKNCCISAARRADSARAARRAGRKNGRDGSLKRSRNRFLTTRSSSPYPRCCVPISATTERS